MNNDFEVRRQGHTDLFGIFLASHAVPDSFCLMHAGVGCKTKGQQHLVNHDWLKESFSRSGWSEISDIEVISGSEERLKRAIMDWIGRRSPSVMAVATTAFVELRGENFAESIGGIKDEGGCRLLYIPAHGYEGDLYRGYSAYIEALIRTMDWASRKPREELVNVIGYLFDRYEMDHRANYNELDHLLRGIGLKLHRVLLSGAPYRHLQDAPEAGLQICLPYVASLPDAVGRPSVRTHLPFGLHGTRTWLELVGKAAGVNKARVESFIDEQLRKIVPILQPAVDRLQGLRTLLFADTARASAIAAFLNELGVRVQLVGLTDRTLGGKKMFMRCLRQQDAGFPDSMDIIENPSPRQLRQSVKRLIKENDIDFIIGSSYELQDMKDLKAAKIEIGFPSYKKHFIYPMPDLGFAGALSFVQRLMNALASVH